MRTAEELRELVDAGGATPERRALYEAWFAHGAPRKVRALAERLDLAQARVLDVGCGAGTYLAHFSAQSVGIDRDPSRVEFVRSLRLDARVRDVEAPGWAEGLGTFDLVWLCDLLVHLREPRAFLASVAPLLNAGGAVVVVEWLWPRSDLAARALARVVPGGARVLHEPEHLHRFDRGSLRALLADTGFEVEDEWLHTFRSPLATPLFGAWWPPRTILARPAPRPPR